MKLDENYGFEGNSKNTARYLSNSIEATLKMEEKQTAKTLDISNRFYKNWKPIFEILTRRRSYIFSFRFSNAETIKKLYPLQRYL